MTKTKQGIEAARPVESLIQLIRDQKVILDVHLGELYGFPPNG